MSNQQDLMQTLDTTINNCVDKWSGAVTKAIEKVKAPPSLAGENKTMFYAEAAAAGNMIWAATCLVAESTFSPLVVAVMSFGGAGLASVAGVLAAVPPGQTPAEAILGAMRDAAETAKKKLLSDHDIAIVKKSLYAQIVKDHPAWRTHFGINDGNIRQLVWKHLFQSPYGAGLEDAAEVLRARIEKSLSDFYVMAAERYKFYIDMVGRESYEKVPVGVSPMTGNDYNVLLREQYVEDAMSPIKFVRWLNTDPTSVSKIRVFRMQHLIPL